MFTQLFTTSVITPEHSFRLVIELIALKVQHFTAMLNNSVNQVQPPQKNTSHTQAYTNLEGKNRTQSKSKKQNNRIVGVPKVIRVSFNFFVLLVFC